MHLHARHTGSELLVQGASAPPFGPGFTVTQLANVDALEVWVTSLTDVADTTVWRFMRDSTVAALSEVGGF